MYTVKNFLVNQFEREKFGQGLAKLAYCWLARCPGLHPLLQSETEVQRHR